MWISYCILIGERDTIISNHCKLEMLASKRSKQDTIWSNQWKLEIYLLYVRPHFSNVGTVVCNVGGVKCQPFFSYPVCIHLSSYAILVVDMGIFGPVPIEVCAYFSVAVSVHDYRTPGG